MKNNAQRTKSIVDEKAARIKALFELNNESYMEWIIKELEPDHRFGSASIENTRVKKEFLKTNGERPSSSNKYLDDGLYGSLADEPPLQELDFEQFSFKILQHYSDDDNLIDTIKAIQQLPRSRERKNFRIKLFESLETTPSPYFDIETYRKIINHMIEALNTTESLIQEKGYDVQSKTFDSFTFIAHNQEAREVQQYVNDQLPVSKLNRRVFTKGINLYHIFRYTVGCSNGQTHERLQTRTKYHEVLSNVIDSLYAQKNWGRAFRLLSKAKTNPKYNTETIKKYTAKLNKIRRSENFKAD